MKFRPPALSGNSSAATPFIDEKISGASAPEIFERKILFYSDNGRAGVAQAEGNQHTGQNRHAGRHHPQTAPPGEFLGQIQPHQPQHRNQNGQHGTDHFNHSPKAHTAGRKHIQEENQAVTNQYLHHEAFQLTIAVTAAVTTCHGTSLGMICLNGAAARMVQVKDHIIIMSYCDLTPDEAIIHKPKVVFVDENNEIKRISCYERHGQLSD